MYSFASWSAPGSCAAGGGGSGARPTARRTGAKRVAAKLAPSSAHTIRATATHFGHAPPPPRVASGVAAVSRFFFFVFLDIGPPTGAPHRPHRRRRLPALAESFSTGG